MKSLISFFLIFLAGNIHAQVWIEQGAVWHYNYGNLMEGGFIRITNEKDTLINGQKCEQLQPVQFKFTWDQYGNIYFLDSIPWKSEYTYTHGDTVFYLENGSFYVLYNFGAQPGDSWDLGVETNYWSCSDSRAVVDSIGTTILNGQELRWISISHTEGSSVALDGMAIERFGAAENYLFPVERNCDSNIIVEFNSYDFSCFQDNEFPLINMTDKDCEFLLTSGHNNIVVQEVMVFPNPTKNQINILVHGPADIELFDHNGLLFIRRSNHQGKLDISKLSRGVYFLRIILDNHICMKKIIKE